jgi:hypothetical protein
MRRRILVFAGLLLAAAAAATAQPLLADPPARTPFEFGLFGGFSLSQVKGTTAYADQWGSYVLLNTVKERTSIATSVKSGIAAGGFISYYFSSGFGVQILVGGAKSDVPNTADTAFSWTWIDGTSGQKTASWAGTGSFTVIPVSLNLVARIGGRGSVLDAVFSAGATAFRSSFAQDSFFGYGITKLSLNADGSYTQYVDALKVGLTMPNGTMKKTLFGADFGAGLTLRISDRIGIRADVRYYYCPEQVLTWSFVLGKYDGVFFNEIKGEAFDANDVKLLGQTSNTFSMRINPSLIHATLGLVFSFGGGR